MKITMKDSCTLNDGTVLCSPKTFKFLESYFAKDTDKLIKNGDELLSMLPIEEILSKQRACLVQKIPEYIVLKDAFELMGMKATIILESK